MRFMERMMTSCGVGVAVGMGPAEGGTVLVSIRREDFRGREIQGPCAHVWVRWCDAHQVWFEGAVCGRCEAEQAGRAAAQQALAAMGGEA